MVQFPSHTQRATQRDLAREQSLLHQSTISQAQGERPLWEFVKRPVEAPLGDTARLLREQHAGARKAKAVWEN